MVELLLENGANVNAIDERYYSSLRAAASGGHKDIVQVLLDRGADINIDDGHESGTVLEQVLDKDDLPMFQLLSGIRKDTRVANGIDSLLYTASRDGHSHIVETILRDGHSPDVRGYDGPLIMYPSAGLNSRRITLIQEYDLDVRKRREAIRTALQAAAVRGHEEIVRLLLESGADPDIWEGDDGSALYAASMRGRKTIVHLLLEKGADPNIHQDGQKSCLQAACQGNYLSIVQELLQRGADVNASGKFAGFYRPGQYHEIDTTSPLTTACFEGPEKIASLILDSGANVNFQGGIVCTALQAASYKGHERIVEMLLERGADPHIHGGGYGNALCPACAMGHEKIARSLLDYGADINQGGHEGRTALFYSAKDGHSKIVQLLLTQGAKICIQGELEPCPLRAASIRGHEDIVKVLLENDIDRQDPDGKRRNEALCAASSKNQKRVVRLLLDHEADIQAENTPQLQTALEIAAGAGHKTMVQLLLERGARPGSGSRKFGEVLASAREYTSIAKILLQFHAETGLSQEDCAIALGSAIEKGSMGVITILLNTGVDINDRYIFRRHPLDIAAKRGG